MNDNSSAPPLILGQRYLVRYRGETHRRDRTAVMVYLGEDGDRLVFDARPVAGTQFMPRAWVLAVEPVAADTPSHVNRVAP
jgi:hypothetical protein